MKTPRDYRPLFEKLLVMFKKKYPRRVRNVLGLRYRVGFNDGVFGYMTDLPKLAIFRLLG